MKRSNLKIIIFATGFLICLVVFLYPTISNFWNQHLNDGLIHNYNRKNYSTDDPNVTAMWEDAQSYNEHFRDVDALQELGLSYSEVLNPNGDGMMGYLEIPKIRVELPIYHGLDDSDLQTGVGHMDDTPLPIGGKGIRPVLAGHTGLATAKLLSNLDQLRIGDLFRIDILGTTLTYQVVSTVVVLPGDIKHLAPLEGEDLVTLVTCTPYGVNSHRLLVTGARVSEEELTTRSALFTGSDLEIVDPRYTLPAQMIIIAILAGITYIIVYIIKQRGKKHED